MSPELEAALAAEAEEVRAADAEVGDGGNVMADEEETAKAIERPGVLRRSLRWIRARGGATERVIRELRVPESLTVLHPAGLPGHAARRIFRQRVEAAVRHHRRWLLADGALLPLSVLFTLVPGPNLVLPYLAWRTLAHWRGRAGASRALQSDGPASTFVPEPALDPLLDLADRRLVLHRKRKLREIGDRAGIPDLDRHL